MATAERRPDHPVREFALAHFSQFDSFQLLRVLKWQPHVETGDGEQGGAGGGGGGDGKGGAAAVQPAHAPRPPLVRFRAELSAAFPGHEFTKVTVRTVESAVLGTVRNAPGVNAKRVQREVIEIKTPNYCVASVLGPFPEPFTEWVRDLNRAHAPVMGDFLDMFNHRLNVLRYRFKQRQTLALNNLPPERTLHAAKLAAIMGLGSEPLAAQVPLPKRAWLGLAGLLANRRRSAAMITQVLSAYLGAKVKLQQLVGAWRDIEPEDRMELGRVNHRLGANTVLGRRVWDQQARVRLVVAPVGYQRFCALLQPGHDFVRHKTAEERAKEGAAKIGAAYEGFVGLLRLVLDRLHDCEVLLQVHGPFPPSKLSAYPERIAEPAAGGTERDGAEPYFGLRLGRTAWLGSAAQAGESAQSSDSAQVRRVGYLIHAFPSEEGL